ncbi:MAG: hypothetical protein ACHBN1_10065 [Heteroscytonema crispum UTEX LB 1556]
MGDKGEENVTPFPFFPYAQFPMPNAQCPMPNFPKKFKAWYKLPINLMKNWCRYGSLAVLDYTIVLDFAMFSKDRLNCSFTRLLDRAIFFHQLKEY